MTPSEQTMREQCIVVAMTCVGGNLRRATRAVTQVYAEIMAPSGLQPTQFTLLAACTVAGTVPITALAEALVMDRTTLTRNVNLLAKQGFVKVGEGRDRRVRVVELTEAGRRALAEALPFWKQAQTHMVERLGPQRVDVLLRELSGVVEITR